MSDPDFREDTRLYVIGDIHGRLDLLDRVIEGIHRDSAQWGGPSLVVTVGDYIDRGPKSRGVIERLASNPFPCPYVALKGNHEELLETFLANPTIGEHWRRLGGLETIASFGVPVSDLMRGRGYDVAAERLADSITDRHAGFINSLRISLTVGRYFLCHAGVRPGVRLDRQVASDLLWIRDEFLNSTAEFGKVVVHGHTPVPEPEIRRNRINIDTGAFATGRLTCIVLENGDHRFIG